MQRTLARPTARALTLGAALLVPTALLAQRAQPVAATAPSRATPPSRATLALPAEARVRAHPRRPGARRHLLRGALAGVSVGAVAGGAYGAYVCRTTDDCMWPALTIGLPAGAGVLAGGTAGALLGGVVYRVRR